MPPKSVRLPPDTATILERSRGVLFVQWEELLRSRRTVLKSSNPDDIHDLRVASRRFRAALELFYPFAPKGSRTELKKDVRKLTRLLDALRNIDEALIFFTARTGRLDNSAICQALAEQRSREYKRVHKALTHFDHCTLDRLVREMVAVLNEDLTTERNRFSLLAYFSEVSIRQYMSIHHSLTVSSAPEQRASRHKLRIGIKKWRYFLETIAPVLECNYTHILGLLKEYQTLLGRMNDIDMFEELLCTLAFPPVERKRAEAALLAEYAFLMKDFTDLVEQKPLAYTFIF